MPAVMAKHPDIERDFAAGATTRSGTFVSRFSSYLARAFGGPQDIRNAWALLTGYERFEQAVSLALTVLISVLVIITLLRLTYQVCNLVAFQVIDPNQPEVFQAIFGMVMTVLIALELNHSVLSVLERRHGVVQVRTVVLIAILALVQKSILIDFTQETPFMMLGLAASTLALGAVYWMVREQDQRAVKEEGLNEQASSRTPEGNSHRRSCDSPRRMAVTDL
jgi:uncharacterized membrane protein (DUF373 family)